MHGRDDLLEKMHARIELEHKLHHAEDVAVIVHLGDYIDGGGNSIGVIDRLMRGVRGVESVCLKGNHEALMLACLETDDRQVWLNWITNGGGATLESLDLKFRFGGFEPDHLAAALGQPRIDW